MLVYLRVRVSVLGSTALGGRQDQGVNREMVLCDRVPSPLLLGIQSGHMSERQLAKVAAPTSISLRTFIAAPPRRRPQLRRCGDFGFEISRASHVCALRLVGGKCGSAYRAQRTERVGKRRASGDKLGSCDAPLGQALHGALEPLPCI